MQLYDDVGPGDIAALRVQIYILEAWLSPGLPRPRALIVKLSDILIGLGFGAVQIVEPDILQRKRRHITNSAAVKASICCQSCEFRRERGGRG